MSPSIAASRGSRCSHDSTSSRSAGRALGSSARAKARNAGARALVVEREGDLVHPIAELEQALRVFEAQEHGGLVEAARAGREDARDAERAEPGLAGRVHHQLLAELRVELLGQLGAEREPGQAARAGLAPARKRARDERARDHRDARLALRVDADQRDPRALPRALDQAVAQHARRGVRAGEALAPLRPSARPPSPRLRATSGLAW